VDRGLILENPRGLSVKSAKSRPRVDFTKVQGPLCKNAGEFLAGNYFPTDKSVDRRRRGHRARWRAHRSLASGRSGVPKLTGGGAKRRGERGKLGSGHTIARATLWRTGDGGAERGGGGAER
jgi:hypothetical protein